MSIIEPKQLRLSTGIANNDTVTTRGYVDDKFTDTVITNSLQVFKDAGGWIKRTALETAIREDVGADIRNVILNYATNEVNYTIWGTATPLIHTDAANNVVGIGTVNPDVNFMLTVDGNLKTTGGIGSSASRVSKIWATDFDSGIITVDNLVLDANTLSATSGDLNLTCVAGSDIKLTAGTTNEQLIIKSNDGMISIQKWDNDKPFDRFYRRIRGSSIVQSGDGIVEFSAQAWDGATYQDAASIKMIVDGTPGLNDMPGAIELYTVADGATTLTKRLKIDNTGLSEFFGSVKVDNLNLDGSTLSATVTNFLYLKAGTNRPVVAGDGLVTAFYNANFVVDGVVEDDLNGPHIATFVSTDLLRPLFYVSSFAHDDVSINFDAYKSSGNYISSDVGSNYQIHKYADGLLVRYKSGIAAGSPITWETALRVGTSGLVNFFGAVQADTINEHTADNGVVIEGNLFKDSKIQVGGGTSTMENNSNSIRWGVASGKNYDFRVNSGTKFQIDGTGIKCNRIDEISIGGVTIDSVLLKDNSVTANSMLTDDIYEKTTAHGVVIDGVLLKDGYVNQSGIFASIFVSGGATPQSIATGTTYVKLTSFTTNGENSNCTSDFTNNKLTINQIGRYRLVGRVCAKSGTANVIWEGVAFVNGAAKTNLHWKQKMTTNTDVNNMGFNDFIDVTSVPWDIDMRVRHDSGGATNITVEYATLNAKYVGST